MTRYSPGRRLAESSGEATMRAGSLRRSDWRFLLCVTRFDRSVVVADPGLSAALKSVSDEMESSFGRGDRADLVALDKTRAPDLAEAVRTLDSRGACYIEEYRPRLGGPGRIRRRLHRAGFAEVECYWMWPPPRRHPAQFWLPPDRGATGYFLRSRPAGRGTRQRVVGAASKLVWRAVTTFGAAAPLCALAWKTAEGRTRSLAAQLKHRWATWGLGPEPQDVSCLMLTGGEHERNKVVVLAFPDRSTRPSVALKMARTHEAEPGLRREAGVLLALADSPIHEVADVPRVVYFGSLGEVTALAESVVEGRPIWTSLTEKSLRSIATEVSRLLLAAVSPEPPMSTADIQDRLISPVVDDFRSRFGSVIEADQLDGQIQRLRSLPELPLAVEHRDCSPWNVLYTSSGRLGLVDWESAEPRGLPLMDLLYFLANAAFMVEGTLGTGSETRTYRGIVGRSAVGIVVSEVVQLHCEMAGIQSGCVRTLTALAWMVHACVEHDRLATDHPEWDSGAIARHSLYLSLWREECAQHARGEAGGR